MRLGWGVILLLHADGSETSNTFRSNRSQNAVPFLCSVLCYESCLSLL